MLTNSLNACNGGHLHWANVLKGSGGKGKLKISTHGYTFLPGLHSNQCTICSSSQKPR